MARARTGYRAKAVSAYVNGQVEIKRAASGRGMHQDARFINGRRLTADHGRRLLEWAKSDSVADLAVVDRMLIYYDLALWEFEHWAIEQYGDNTFCDAGATAVLQLAAK